ncbi:MAG TPA: T9SS type A sorting domain-containing protein, partial [Chitinophagales bacterium]|nr:T9SS type A sorting domain-containing protein [Chitinophagales bacterium]
AASASLTLSPSATATTCGATNGSATVNITAGSGPYTYHWSNNASTQTINNVASGNYSVTVTGSGGCSATAATSVAPSTALAVSVTGVDAGCGGNNGSATANITTGSGPYTYVWSNNATTATINNLGAGSYSVTVTGTGNCTASGSVSVQATNNISLSATSTNTSCGNNNGGASVSVTAGSGPYTYAWSNGATTASINNVAAGTYTVTVTGNGGCTGTATATINPSGNTGVNITSDKSIMCAGDSAQICAPGGYNAYSWNNGATTQCIEATLAGNYYVTVTDAGSCTATSNHLGLSLYPIPPVTITVSGDTLTSYNAVTYQWFLNGQPIQGATSNILIATQSGNYQVAITDQNGCYAISNASAVIVSSIENVSADGQVKVYPNPLASGNWNLEVTENWIGGECQVFDAEGRIVYHDEIRDLKTQIPLEVARGVYIMRLSSEQKNYAIKLIKLY